MDLAGLAAGWAGALEGSVLGTALRQSAVAYPLANIVHLLGLVLLVGSAVLLDLRLLGAGRRAPADIVSRLLTPVMLAGLAVMVGSGVLLFAADARALVASDAFAWKLAAIALALVNALTFRWLWRFRLTDWDDGPPFLGRVQAGTSLALWLAAATLGRLIAYL